MAAIGRGPLLFRSWTREVGYIEFKSWGNSPQLLYPASFIVRPPFVVPRIVPVGNIDLLTWKNPLSTNLLNQDKFFGAAGSPPTYDWPNPRGYVPSIDLRTWLQGTDPQTVPGSDVFFGLAGNPNFDWPVPRCYIPVIDLKTHVDQLKLNLQSQDTFFQGAGQTQTYDYPNPRGYPYPHWLVSWTDVLKLNTLVTASPFANSNQPNPLGVTQNYDLRTWDNVLNLSLLSNDQFFGAGGANQFDWPVPRGYVPSIDLRSWINQSNFSLAVTSQPFLPANFQNPRGYVPAVALNTWAFGLPLDILGQDKTEGLGGFPKFDWPNPRGYIPSIDLKTWIDPLKLNLRSQDTFFSGSGSGPDYDWPNPRGYTPAIDLKTWAWPLSTNLLHQDTFFGAAGQPPANLDWPAPRGYIPGINLKTWVHNNTAYLSPVIVPAFNYDWPVPRGYVPAVDLKTWANLLSLTLFGKDQLFGGPGQPLPNLDWPVPRGYVPSIDLRTGLNVFNTNIVNLEANQTVFRPLVTTRIWPADPYIMTRGWVNQSNFALQSSGYPIVPPDFPNPNGYAPNQLRTWNWENMALFIGPAIPLSFDWQNPYLKVPGVDPRGFAVSLNLLLTPPPVVTPSINYDFPNPIGKVPSIDLKTWANGFSINLLGKDVLFGGAGQPLPNLDWPVPKGPVPGVDLKTWTNVFNINIAGIESQSTSLRPLVTTRLYSLDSSVANASQYNVFQNNRSLFVPIAEPFSNYDLPNPTAPVQGVFLKTWTDQTKLSLLNKDTFFGAAGQPPANLDWPVPRGPSSGIDRWGFVANFNQLIQPVFTPFNETDWPVPSGPVHNYFLKTWVNIVNPNLMDSFFGAAGQPPANLDWPNPRGYPYPSWIQTWTDPLEVNLLHQDKFFGAAGQPPANLDWPVPKGAAPRAVDIFGFISPLNIAVQPLPQAPFTNYDQPNPVLATPPGIIEKVFTSSIITEFGVFKPFLNYDQPNPVRAVAPAVTMLTLIDQTKINLIGTDKFFGAGPPTYDWPNPRGYIPGISLKTWTDMFKLELIGKDKFFGGTGQAPANLDWPVPKGYVPLIDLKTITQSTNLSLLNPVVFFGPFANYDQPNPTLAKTPPAPQPQPYNLGIIISIIPSLFLIPPQGGGKRKKRGSEQPIWDRQRKPRVELPPFAVKKKAEIPPAFVVNAKAKKSMSQPVSLDVGYANPIKIEQKIREAQQDMEDIKALLPVMAAHLAQR